MTTEIITVAQMQAIDAAASTTGVPTRTLMENAGRAVADEIARRFSPCPTVVLCGPGNNGGDGWVAARALQERGWPVAVRTLVPIEALKGDASDAARAWRGETAPLGSETPVADLFVDALFGAGLSRSLTEKAAHWGHVLACSPDKVVAVDVPSGINGDTGKVLGEVAVRANLTVTFVRKKPAHVLFPGRAFCGDVVVADIGVPEAALAAQDIRLHENCPALWRMPWPTPETHKHARGHAMVASGGRAATGAARLAARAALRGGAGLVTVLSPPDAIAENAAQLTAIMLREVASAEAYADALGRSRAFVIGPAFGTAPLHRTLVEMLARMSPRPPVVFDADAITLLAPIRTPLGAADVFTPHVGEFGRAFPGMLVREANRIDAARAAAREAGCVVLLKGPDTVIAAPDGRAVVNTTGTAHLATAGAGDVLAGLIGGLIAQGMASFDAAAAGAWLHGRAAEALGPGLIAEDLPDVLPSILKQLHALQ